MDKKMEEATEQGIIDIVNINRMVVEKDKSLMEAINRIILKKDKRIAELELGIADLKKQLLELKEMGGV